MQAKSTENQLVRARCEKYLNRAEVLRQIHSNKAFRCERYGRLYVIVSVVLAAIVGFISFAGIDSLRNTLSGWHKLSSASLSLSYNLLVLAIIVITVLGLIYRYDERAAKHHHAIVRLTDFIRDLDDAIALSRDGSRLFSSHDLDLVRERYKGITDGLPPSTDKEYLQSKKDFAEKKAKSRQVQPGQSSGNSAVGRTNSQADRLAAELSELLLSDVYHLAVLKAIRDVLGSSVWLCGGFVRDLVWDQLHGYAIPTPNEDVDVIYFDANDITKRTDTSFESKLQALNPHVKWSVKNEARIGAKRGCQYGSLLEALQSFPETASAVAVQIDNDDKLEIIAPYGLDDLFAGIIRRSPLSEFEDFRQRLSAKCWLTSWPELQVFSPGAVETFLEGLRSLWRRHPTRSHADHLISSRRIL